MAAFSHNGEPGSALDAELKGRDTRHMEGYSAGFKAGREAGMREASEICQLEKVDAESTNEDADEAYNLAITHCTEAILAEIGK